MKWMIIRFQFLLIHKSKPIQFILILAKALLKPFPYNNLNKSGLWVRYNTSGSKVFIMQFPWFAFKGISLHFSHAVTSFTRFHIWTFIVQ
jgi:hypothetical protein